ncbi:hypothetical protein NM208_g1978 [Fusarium decemcellulare]|uniref:Uncharacterized protein n=1 Tax=Fusarium decemcellulare TaxID=57161 RepID=A0ACC1SUJ4_9HYPO|nr:hypothetical protein NM208_g1978 [Fusarium decemcellulare]
MLPPCLWFTSAGRGMPYLSPDESFSRYSWLRSEGVYDGALPRIQWPLVQSRFHHDCGRDSGSMRDEIFEGREFDNIEITGKLHDYLAQGVTSTLVLRPLHSQKDSGRRLGQTELSTVGFAHPTEELISSTASYTCNEQSEVTKNVQWNSCWHYLEDGDNIKCERAESLTSNELNSLTKRIGRRHSPTGSREAKVPRNQTLRLSRRIVCTPEDLEGPLVLVDTTSPPVIYYFVLVPDLPRPMHPWLPADTVPHMGNKLQNRTKDYAAAKPTGINRPMALTMSLLKDMGTTA